MFLSDAVAAYVESLTERELDAPLIALLHRLGFRKVHLVHGGYEFGKDLIARRVEDGVEFQYCLQSKAGNLGAKGWRDVRQQVDAMRSGSVVHPDFDPLLPRRLVVVTNGRLAGGAGTEFQDYNAYHVGRGEVPAEVWDIDHLVPDFVSVLVEGVRVQDRARTLELLGVLGQGNGSRLMLRDYGRSWIDVPVSSASERWSQVLTGAMLAKTALEQGREDLASQVAFLLIRAAWENPLGGAVSGAELDVARRIFVTGATAVWERARDVDSLEVTTHTRSGLGAFVTHPVACARLCETLSLLGLYLRLDGDVGQADAITGYVEGVVSASPGLSHPVSDEWAYSILVSVTLLATAGRRDAARAVVREAAVWLLDWVEHGSGVAGVGEGPEAELRQLLGGPYPGLSRAKERSAYGFAVLADMAFLCGFDDLYGDNVSDLDAVGAMASLVVDAGPGAVDLVARVAWSVEGTPARHHEVAAAPGTAAAAGAYFDCLATWATTRDRHLPSVLARLLGGDP